jgi:predicted nuclease of restriction endonuclease-like RecB superfamily
MLTPDLVHTRRKKDALEVISLGARRELAMELAEITIDLAEQHVGRAREELELAWQAIEVEPRNRKLLDGIQKLVTDQLVFESDLGRDAVALRAEVFERAAEARRELASGEEFNRMTVLEEVANAHSMDVTELERALYSDLRGKELLREALTAGAKALVGNYDLAQIQAVLLRASRVTAHLEQTDPGALRALFRKLKFSRLLHTAHRERNGYRLEIDGPYSLFESVTKYGLALALALPALMASGRHRITADLRWGKERLPLRFKMEGEALGRPDDVPIRLSEDAEMVRTRLLERAGAWSADIADTIIDLPGVGACIPDLVCTHQKSGARVFVEVMGYWSRDAVWKRVELAERGLEMPILFCVSERLRVSEAVLPEGSNAALLVYKGVIPMAALEEKLARLASSS